VYLLVGLVGFLALIKGFQIWFGWPWIAAVIPAFIVAEFPIVGAIVGAKGAVEGWGWSLTAAITFFAAPYLLWIAVIAFAWILEKSSSRD
jgi:hypothetical protein